MGANWEKRGIERWVLVPTLIVQPAMLGRFLGCKLFYL